MPLYRMVSGKSTLDSAVKENKTKCKQFSKQPITSWLTNLHAVQWTSPCIEVSLTKIILAVCLPGNRDDLI